MSRTKARLSLIGLSALIILAEASRADAAQLTIDSVSIVRGVDYAPTAATPSCAASPLGGFDGFDCGLNLVTTTTTPGLTSAPGSVALGTARLAERALITLGMFPVGDGRSLANLGLTVTFDVNGAPLTFNGSATDFVGGAPGSTLGLPAASAPGGAQTRTDFCNNPATTVAACVNDPALDFRVAFSPAQAFAVGPDTVTLSLLPLAFFNNSDSVELTLVSTLQGSSPAPEPASLAVMVTALVAFCLVRPGRGPC